MQLTLSMIIYDGSLGMVKIFLFGTLGGYLVINGLENLYLKYLSQTLKSKDLLNDKKS